MDVEEARAMAGALMREHGLDGWRLVVDRARTRAGVCRYLQREIGLSRVLTELHSREEVRDTVLHEIAHALVGPSHGHDAVWRAAARAIGGTGQRCLPATAPRAPAPWVGTCPAGHTATRHRRPQRVTACTRCSRSFSLATVHEWRLHGQLVAMTAAYTSEMARLKAAAAAGNRWRPDLDDLPAPPSGDPSGARPGRLGGGARPGSGGSGPGSGSGSGSGSGAAAARGQAGPSAVGGLPVGALVRLVGPGAGRFSGTVGRIEKRGRTRYHVRTRDGLVTAHFPLVELVSRELPW